MRTVFEDEEEAVAPDEARSGDRSGRDPELTVSSTTLLAIFFGLVLLCGLFFGLGYTLGRRAPADAAETPAAPAVQAASGQPKPSAAAETALRNPAPDGSQAAADDAATPFAPQADGSQPASEAAPAAAAAQNAKVAPVPLANAGAAGPVAANSQPPAASAPIAVQVAAISNPADADVLVRALEKRGYSVTTRTAPGDAFIHVQVGPFSTRAEAAAMRQRLLADGYNAILK